MAPMINRERVKRTGSQLIAKVPVYKIIPPGKFRDYAAIRHLMESNPSRIPDYLSATGRIPDWRYSSLYQSATALFNRCDDERARQFAEHAVHRYPEHAEAHVILSELDELAGDYPTALRHAQDAWLLEPELQDAAAQVIRLSHLSELQDASDTAAILALRRFPNNHKILWTACRHCESRSQLLCIQETWLQHLPAHLPTSRGSRALALTALHLEWYDMAAERYVDACLDALRGAGVNKPLRSRNLANTQGLSVLKEMSSVLNQHHIPFFFAAGTVLGIVRDGKPLDHDDDIDVGIFEEDWDREKLLSAFTRHTRFKVEPTMASKPKLRLTHRSGAQVDIFRFYREHESIYHDGNFVRWRNSHFETSSHQCCDGESVPVPSPTDQYLTENYGNWRDPDPSFDAFVEGPNVEVINAEYWNVHRLRRAYKFLRNLNVDAARLEILAVEDWLHSIPKGMELVALANV